MLLLRLLILIVLLLIFAQDLKSRSVYWILFPVLTVLFIAARLLQHAGWKEIGETVMINAGFLIVQLLIVTAYFSAKSKRWVNITAELLGWGDVLFLISISFYLSVLNFLAFYIGSLILALLAWLGWQALMKNENKHIPLAGLQSILLALFLAGDWWFFHLNITNDNWLLSYMIK